MSETPQPEPQSLYKQHETATVKYYGADTDPFKFVPVVQDKDVAHEVANVVERQLSQIDEAEIARQAVSEQARYRLGKMDPAEIEENKQELLDYRLRQAVVNTELTHASIAPEDFNEDARKSGAFQMGSGTELPPNIPKPRDS